jgi:uncharacterized membrane-anchored protein
VEAISFCNGLSRTVLFWAAFILIRPLGAGLGDLLTKPLANDGCNIGGISLILGVAVLIMGGILFTQRKTDDGPER